VRERRGRRKEFSIKLEKNNPNDIDILFHKGNIQKYNAINMLAFYYARRDIKYCKNAARLAC